MTAENTTFLIEAVGTVNRAGGQVRIAIDPPYRAALQALDTFSHVIVYWWADRFDIPECRDMLVTPLPYAEGREAGVFASRAPVRPNLIMSTVCAIEEVDVENGTVRVGDIDAFDGTPVVDLKAYFPIMDRVEKPRISPYLEGWPEWLPTEGIGLMAGEDG